MPATAQRTRTAPKRAQPRDAQGRFTTQDTTADSRVRALKIARPTKPAPTASPETGDDVLGRLAGYAVCTLAGLMLLGGIGSALRTESYDHLPWSVPSASAHSPDHPPHDEVAWTDDAEEATAVADEIDAALKREAAIARNLERYRRYPLRRDLAEMIYDAAVANRIDPDLAFGLVRVESEFNPRAISPVGARGLGQLMPETAAEMKPGITTEQMHDPATNLDLSFRYLRWLLKKYGDRKLALTAYNRGPGTVDKVLTAGGDPDNGYNGMVTARLR